MEHILLGMLAFFGGLLISWALVALILELNLVSRFAFVTHTAHHLKLYEGSMIAGAVLGNLAVIYGVPVSLPLIALAVFGTFSGIYVGSWIVALAEVLDIFPVLSRKINLKKGLGILIAATALGKSLFTVLFYYFGW